MKKVRVFYLDDEVELLIIFKETFESETIQIATFTDPEALIRAVTETSPDLVFLDYRLPFTTGQEVAKKLPLSLTKVLLTGDLNLSSLTGFKEVLHKPFSFERIQALLESCQALL
jgi:CheY-like chemotaxis protein